jgi:hypothetical protein
MGRDQMLSLTRKVGAYVKKFKTDENAAVTVDWVVLTAGIVGMVVFMIQHLTLPVETISTAVADGITQFGSD